MAAPGKFALDEIFISSDAGNGWAACYHLVNGRIKGDDVVDEPLLIVFRTSACGLLALAPADL